jgi:tetratricopeptide (TPR) repeat protein
MPRVLIFALVFGVCTAPAYADDRDKALQLFEDSDKAYKAGEFERATDLLREAYTLYPEPLLLYNLGRAQEGLGDAAGAVESYERYLDTAKQIKDRGAIERRIATLRAQLEKAERDERRRIADEERRRREAEERERNPPPIVVRSPLETYGPWITMATGGAVVATGLFFGVHAQATHDDALATPIQRDAAALQESAERSARIANVLFVIGGVALAGGIGWKIWQWQSDGAPAATSAQLTVAPGSVAVEWVWR